MKKFMLTYRYNDKRHRRLYQSLPRAMQSAEDISKNPLVKIIEVSEILCRFKNGKYITTNQPCVSTNELSEMDKAPGS